MRSNQGHADINAQEHTCEKEVLESSDIRGGTRDQFTGVGFIMVSEREPLQRFVNGRANISKASLYEAIPNRSQNKSHPRPNQHQRQKQLHILRNCKCLVGHFWHCASTCRAAFRGNCRPFPNCASTSLSPLGERAGVRALGGGAPTLHMQP